MHIVEIKEDNRGATSQPGAAFSRIDHHRFSWPDIDIVRVTINNQIEIIAIQAVFEIVGFMHDNEPLPVMLELVRHFIQRRAECFEALYQPRFLPVVIAKHSDKWAVQLPEFIRGEWRNEITGMNNKGTSGLVELFNCADYFLLMVMGIADDSD